MSQFDEAFEEVLAAESARQDELVATQRDKARWRKMLHGCLSIGAWAEFDMAGLMRVQPMPQVRPEIFYVDHAAVERRVAEAVGIPPETVGGMALLYGTEVELRHAVDLAVRGKDKTAGMVVMKSRTGPNKNNRVYLAGSIGGRSAA